MSPFDVLRAVADKRPKSEITNRIRAIGIFGFIDMVFIPGLISANSFYYITPTLISDTTNNHGPLYYANSRSHAGQNGPKGSGLFSRQLHSAATAVID